MGLNVNSVDMNYYYDEPLIDMERFAELFITSLAYDDGVLNLNESTVSGKIAFDYEEKIAEYIKKLEDKSKIAEMIDIGFYYANTDIWFNWFNKTLNNYIRKNKDIKLSIKPNIDDTIITMPVNRVFSVLDKYDKTMVKNIIELTTFINKKEETELERFAKMIEQVGIENPKVKIRK